MTPPVTGLVVDAIGFLTGTALYLMLLSLVWRERAAEGAPLLSRRGRLPLLTGLCGVAWNVGAFVSFASRMMGTSAPSPVLVAVAFGALGCLPAVVVHALVEGREAQHGRTGGRVLVVSAYGLSIAAVLLHLAAAFRGQVVPSRAALWLLTGGFGVLMVALLVITRPQAIGRRGVWVAGLSLFAVSALHFGSHAGDSHEAWWVELIGHHASLPLALAILHQDYRFALADLFLKRAIALLLLMGVTLLALSAWATPLLQEREGGLPLDPGATAVLVALWMLTALVYPLLRRAADAFVDRVVLRRPDYPAVQAALAGDLEADDTEAAIHARLVGVLGSAIGAEEVALAPDPLPGRDARLVVAGAALRALDDPPRVFLLRLATVDPPYRAVACGRLAAGRRLLSDEAGFLETVARLASRRIDAVRVAQERLERNLREQAMHRLATEAELRALRAQLNPHFLFNALTTIGYLVQAAPARALETLLRLTHVLRGVLRRTTTEFSTLDEEVAFIRAYLEIEQARFEERLTVTIDVAADAGAARVPTLLLQPLVENAIKHGLTGCPEGGRVRLAARREDDGLVIDVTDSGTGFDPAAVHRGVGLTSVRQRLAAHFGARASMTIDSTPGRGSAIRLQLPFAEGASGAVATTRRGRRRAG
ncbi:MAG: histidine kinase [Vicinamibacterales bacterium]